MIRKGLGQRNYLWRMEAWVINDEDLNLTWDSIVNYFDDSLVEYGWIRGDVYAPCECDLYLPEAAFIEYGQNGYIHYRKSDYSYSQDYYIGDLICLAVWTTGWSDGGSPEIFKIVILTSKPSLLTLILDGLY